MENRAEEVGLANQPEAGIFFCPVCEEGNQVHSLWIKGDVDLQAGKPESERTSPEADASESESVLRGLRDAGCQFAPAGTVSFGIDLVGMHPGQPTQGSLEGTLLAVANPQPCRCQIQHAVIEFPGVDGQDALDRGNAAGRAVVSRAHPETQSKKFDDMKRWNTADAQQRAELTMPATDGCSSRQVGANMRQVRP